MSAFNTEKTADRYGEKPAVALKLVRRRHPTGRAHYWDIDASDDVVSTTLAAHGGNISALARSMGTTRAIIDKILTRRAIAMPANDDFDNMVAATYDIHRNAAKVARIHGVPDHRVYAVLDDVRPGWRESGIRPQKNPCPYGREEFIKILRTHAFREYKLSSALSKRWKRWAREMCVDVARERGEWELYLASVNPVDLIGTPDEYNISALDGFTYWKSAHSLRDHTSMFGTVSTRVIADATGVPIGHAKMFRIDNDLPAFRPDATVSMGETELAEYVGGITTITRGRRWTRDGYTYELDIFCENEKIGIEYNGSYWHSDEYRDAGYHMRKRKFFEALGIKYMAVYDHDWAEKRGIVVDKIRNAIGIAGRRIDARKCSIAPVPIGAARRFLDENHLQGYIRGQHHGLWYDGELVFILTVGRPRFDKTADIEILRMASLLGTNVRGGASRIWAHYIRGQNGHASVVTYADCDNGSGDVYAAMGFRYVGESKPSYFYVKGGTRLSRYQCQKHKIMKLFPDAVGNTEGELMESVGFLRVYDSGCKKFLHVKDK